MGPYVRFVAKRRKRILNHALVSFGLVGTNVSMCVCLGIYHSCYHVCLSVCLSVTILCCIKTS